MARGALWLATLDEARPIVVLSSEDDLDIRAMMLVPSVGGEIAGNAVEVGIGARAGVPIGSVARVAFPRSGQINCSWLVSLSRGELTQHLGFLSAGELDQLDEALRIGQLR